MKQVGYYEWFFDDVQFAIDVRKKRIEAGLSQDRLAKLVGFVDGSSISGIEVAKPSSVTLQTLLALCNYFDLHPSDYFDMQKRGQVRSE